MNKGLFACFIMKKQLVNTEFQVDPPVCNSAFLWSARSFLTPNREKEEETNETWEAFNPFPCGFC